ncbi:MAG TPA: DinB family protein [Dehalococcoidia bacterium]|nr:DinB family protein [Dehalococcoidia bacterium]
MNAAGYAKLQLEQAFNLMNAASDGMDETQYNWAPAGTCNSVAKSHVHAASSIDFFINHIAQGKPLAWPEHGPKLGLPANPQEIWSFSGTVPIAPIAEYSRQLQKAALDYVATLQDSDLDRQIDTQFFGKQSLAFIVQLVGLHCAGHTGDISAVKGMQGLKGLPF